MRLIFSSPKIAAEPIKNSDSAQYDLFLKEMIPEGTWTHPTKGFTLEVDKDRLDKWVRTYKEKQVPNKMNIPVPFGHTYTPQNNAGFIRDLDVRQRADGKFALFGLINIPRSEDSSKIGTTIEEVSVSVNPELKLSKSDGTVEELGEGIEHCALTTYPVIKGMEGFIKLDLGNGKEEVAMQFDYVSQAESAPQAIELDQKTIEQLALGVAVPQEIVDGSRKASHEECKYRSGTGKANCADCLFFLRPAITTSDDPSGDCIYVEGPIKRVDVCDYFQSRYMYDQTRTESQEMKVTPDQLRAMETKFGLEANSLTEDNFFDTVGKIDLATYGKDSDKKKEKKKEGGDMSQDPPTVPPVPPTQAVEFDYSKFDYSKLDPSKLDPAQFDITKHPEFQRLRNEATEAKLTRNRSRLNDVHRRVKTCQASGQLTKAMFDRIFGTEDEAKKTFSFSQDSIGDEWDRKISAIEGHLDLIELMEPTVSTERRTSDSAPSQFDLLEEQEISFAEQADKDLKESSLSAYDQDNIKMDPKTGRFFSSVG